MSALGNRRIASSDRPVEPLVSLTVPVDCDLPLVRVAPSDPDRFAWVRRGEGLVGWGLAARYTVAGPERFSRAHRWWSRVSRDTRIVDEVGLPGTGPVAFATFGFDSDSIESVVALPRFIFGRRQGRSWLTVINPIHATAVEPDEVLARLGTDHPRAPRDVSWPEDDDRVRDWRENVAMAIGRIRAGELDKVVLARDVFARASEPIDPAALLTRLAAEYPDCWAFTVAGLVGATPEMLVRREGDEVSSRVLAGTIRSGWDSLEAGRLAAELLGSDKNLSEHELAVASVAAALAAYCTDLSVPDEPSILQLANVQHLATDVSGLLATETPVLALAASLHPTAAVCGTPTERAHALIRSLEPTDRDRYAGPVGWMDAHGDGEFGIALRCGQIDPVDPRRIRLFAGCGIVAASQPAAEVVESEVKLQPMRLALDSQLSHPVNRRPAAAT